MKDLNCLVHLILHSKIRLVWNFSWLWRSNWFVSVTKWKCVLQDFCLCICNPVSSKLLDKTCTFQWNAYIFVLHEHPKELSKPLSFPYQQNMLISTTFVCMFFDQKWLNVCSFSQLIIGCQKLSQRDQSNRSVQERCNFQALTHWISQQDHHSTSSCRDTTYRCYFVLKNTSKPCSLKWWSSFVHVVSLNFLHGWIAHIFVKE